jgi:hypothetical protein
MRPGVIEIENQAAEALAIGKSEGVVVGVSNGTSS